jgi:hypothetical protein
MPLSVSHLCQTFFRCITCNFTAENGGKGVCESCAAVCHVGHTLSSALSGGFYCDCGSERKCVELARARAGGAGTSAAAPATSAATTQPRQWRNQAVTRKYCSRPGDEEGPLCTHGSDIIRTDHWSCCGVVPRQAACTLVRCSGGGVGVWKCKGCFFVAAWGRVRVVVVWGLQGAGRMLCALRCTLLSAVLPGLG